jgi:hypothetical protein
VTTWTSVKARASWWLLTKAVKALRWLLLAALAAAAWPLTLTAILGYLAAWLSGWPPARLTRAAVWCLPMTGVWLLGHAVKSATWQSVALAAPRDWRTSWHLVPAGNMACAFLVIAPLAIPAGLALAALAWAWRIYAITTGLDGLTATAPITFDARQWRRQVRAARARTAAPGAVPLLSWRGQVPIGGTIRAVGHRWQPVLTVPFAAFGRHMVIVGSSGTGKTNLLMRMWAGWFTAAQAAWTAGTGRRPLLVAVDCKGGPDARVKAARTRRLLHGAGARRVAIWPDEARLSLWAIPPADLAVLLCAMIETGEGSAAYYADIMAAVVALAVTAPCGPPDTAAAFLERLDHGWLHAAWTSDPVAAGRIRAARPHLPDIQLRYATLLSRLGPALDGPGSILDADAWYFILEGTRETAVAEAQAMAITELVAHAATSTSGPRRAILLAADDYSAVSRRVPVSNLYERGRSLGVGVQVSAQSWQGLGADDDERRRIVSTADGGVWVMQTSHPEPLAELAGTRRVLETAHHLVGAAWGDEGTTREQRAWVADPDILRRLDTGQACYIRRGAATYVQVARPRPSPLTLTAASVPQPAGEPAAALPRQREQQEGQPAPDLDDVLGPGAAP